MITKQYSYTLSLLYVLWMILIYAYGRGWKVEKILVITTARIGEGLSLSILPEYHIYSH